MERQDNTRKGLFVQDLNVLDLNGLEEIACLDSQLIDNLKEIKKLIKKEDYNGARHKLTLMVNDTREHLEMIKNIEVDALEKMSTMAILRQNLKAGNTHCNMAVNRRDEDYIDKSPEKVCDKYCGNQGSEDA